MGRMRRATGRRIDSLAKWLLKFRIISIPAKAIASSSVAWSFVSRTDRIRANRLKDRIKKGIVPNHVSIIMDGNRRFAWNSKIETNLGHEKGKEKLKQVMDWILDLGIPYLSVYALSTENIKERNQEELDALYSLYCNGLNEMAEDPKIHSRKVKVKAVGRLEMLPDDVRKAIKNVEEKTADYSDFLFTVCLAYGGREEIVDAVRKVSQEYASGTIKLEEIEKKITPKTKIISITHLSNVTGAILPVKEITDLAHSKGIIVVVDGCQGAPHLKLDMQDLDCDFYAISCHKMYGPTGLGVLYGKKKWLEELPPYQGGGGMISEVKKDRISYGDLPNKYEAGTMATAQVIAFDQSIKFLESIGIENVMKHEAELVEYGQELLKKNNSVKLIGNPKIKGGVLSFILEGVHPHDIATILDEDGVAIRAGHHCCQILHDKLNIPASARASIGVYNTKDDLDQLNESINKCKKIFNL